MKDRTLYIVMGVGVAIVIGALIVIGFSGETKPTASTSPSSETTTTSPLPKEATLEGKPLENFTPVAKIDSLQKIDIVVGTGEEAQASDTVTAHYTGAVAATGIVFQSSLDGGQPIPFGLDQVIAGWTQGVPGMKVGGKRRLLIPASLAYGANPPQGSGIPANADLVFDIELVKIGR